MKNVFNYLAIVAILFMGITFDSCSKDKDESQSNGSSDIVGTWYYEEYDSEENILYETAEITFNSDGTGTGTTHYIHKDLPDAIGYFNYTYDTDAQTLNMFMTRGTETRSFSYHLIIYGDKMIMTDIANKKNETIILFRLRR